MILHTLFCPTQTIAADGSPMPTASLALTLDDEVQYRCAGYIQSEIERFAEEIDDGTSPAADKSEDEDSSGEEDEDMGTSKAKKGKPGKGKKTSDESGASGTSEADFLMLSRVPHHGPRVDSRIPSRTRLETEYQFMGVMSAFLRAIRAGAIDVRHSAILLAHYGRLGSSFDLCSKVIVDILREEGMLNKNGELVVSIVTQAVQEVSSTPVTDNMA
jgi:cohesin complex subunit SA-1/2